MKKLKSLIKKGLAMMHKDLPLGSVLPNFSKLSGADGKMYSSSDFQNAQILIIVFSCNHCPYVRAYEKRIIDFQAEYAKRGVVVVAINSNDADNYPEDDFPSMVKRAKDMNFNFIYIRDEHQKVAGAFGATHTPQFFVFDQEKKLQYKGKMDDNWQDSSQVKENYLKDAVEEILIGKKVQKPETYSIGCTIKWK
jgi:thiol-disulfide isomerase/thioredoxin